MVQTRKSLNQSRATNVRCYWQKTREWLWDLECLLWKKYDYDLTQTSKDRRRGFDPYCESCWYSFTTWYLYIVVLDWTLELFYLYSCWGLLLRVGRGRRATRKTEHGIHWRSQDFNQKVSNDIPLKVLNETPWRTQRGCSLEQRWCRYNDGLFLDRTRPALFYCDLVVTARRSSICTQSMAPGWYWSRCWCLKSWGKCHSVKSSRILL